MCILLEKSFHSEIFITSKLITMSFTSPTILSFLLSNSISVSIINSPQNWLAKIIHTVIHSFVTRSSFLQIFRAHNLNSSLTFPVLVPPSSPHFLIFSLQCFVDSAFSNWVSFVPQHRPGFIYLVMMEAVSSLACLLSSSGFSSLQGEYWNLKQRIIFIEKEEVNIDVEDEN